MVYSDVLLPSWMNAQKLKSPAMKNQPAFYRNIELSLDARRQTQYLMGLKPRWDENVVDYTSCDFLTFSRSGLLREAFLAELARNPEFHVGSGGSHIHSGNYSYLTKVEEEVAEFYGVESVHITLSGFAANTAALAGVLLPGDAVVYDELVHASSHEGLQLCPAEYKIPFRHNDPEALRSVLAGLKKTQPAFAAGTRSILISIESVYSMDGDVAPLAELIQIAKEEYPLGNAQFLVDEAHSVGVLGPQGRGFTAMLGLEKEVAIQVHPASKALGSVGGMILCNHTIRGMLLNHSKALMFSSAPSFPIVASIRAGYQLLRDGAGEPKQKKIQATMRHFYEKLTTNETWEEAVDEGILSSPILDDWEDREYLTHIVPIHTREGDEKFLWFHLVHANINAYPMAFPIVPKGEERLRLIFTAQHTLEQVEEAVNQICAWAREMLDIQQGKSDDMIPNAARRVFAMQKALQG